uniref:Uncharacterized protein n=1 Tax=Rhizophora mucronata TaxID=61149 RepID=A0A2P2N7L5_RHIMU
MFQYLNLCYYRCIKKKGFPSS